MFDNIAAIVFMAVFVVGALWLIRSPFRSIKCGTIHFRGVDFDRSTRPFLFWLICGISWLCGCFLFIAATMVIGHRVYLLFTGQTAPY